MLTTPNPALFSHRPVLQPTNTNTTPINTSPAILLSNSGPRHIAQPTGSANSLTIHALAARPTVRPTPRPVLLATRPALLLIVQPTPAAVPASVTSHPVVQSTVTCIPHSGPLAAVPAFIAAQPLGQPPFADTPHPNPTLAAAPAPAAAHSPGHISPLPAPNTLIDPCLVSQETQDSVNLVNNLGSDPRQTPEPAAHFDDNLPDVEDFTPGAAIQEEPHIQDIDAEVIRLRRIIADQNERYTLAIAAGKISPGMGFHDAPNDSIPKPPKLYKTPLLAAMGFTEADKEIYNCMQSVVRGCMSYCASNYQKQWSLQDPLYVEKVVNIVRSRCPELARYQGGWAVKSMMCSSGKYKRRADVLKKGDPLGTKWKALADKVFSAKVAKLLKEQGLVLVPGQVPALPGVALPEAALPGVALPEAALPGEPSSQAKGNDGNGTEGFPLTTEDLDDHSQALDNAELFATGDQDEHGNTPDDYASFSLHFPTPNDITPLPDIQPNTSLIHLTHPLPPVEAAFAFNETPVTMQHIEPFLDNPSQIGANPLSIGPSAPAAISDIQPLATTEESVINGTRVLRSRPASNTPAPAAKRAKLTSGVAALIQDSKEKGEGEGEGEGEGDVSGKEKEKGKGKTTVGRGRGRGRRGRGKK